MTKVDIKPIIECAQRAPTGDNCQPFHFNWTEPILKVFYNVEVAEHGFNFGHFASRIGLGSAMALIDIAASHQGQKVNWRVFPFDNTGRPLVAEGTFTSSQNIAPDPLYSFVFKRSCNRGPYDGSPLTPEALKDLEDEFHKAQNLHVGLVKGSDQKFINYAKNVELILWRKPHLVYDTFRWVRWTMKSYLTHRDGMHWRELGTHFSEYPAIRLFGLFSWLPRLFISLGLGFIFKNVTDRNLRSSAGVVLYSAREDDPLNMESVGRSALRTWLVATKHDLSMQPLTLQSLPLYGQHVRASLANISDDEHQRFQDGLQSLKNIFKLPDAFLPVWTLRIGRPKQQTQPSLRRPYETTLM